MRRKRESAHPAFTLVKVLITTAIIGLLIAISIPSLSRLHERAHELICLSNARQIDHLTAAFTDDFDGRFPYFGRDFRSASGDPDSWLFRVVFQKYEVLRNDAWHAWAQVPKYESIYECVASPHDLAELPPENYAASFDLVSSMFTKSAYFDPSIPDAEWEGVFPGQLRKLTDVRYPSEKVMVYESLIYHGWRPPHIGGEGNTLGIYGTNGRGAVAMMDGSGRLAGSTVQSAFVDRLNDRWIGGRFDSPAFGIAGRDFLAGHWVNSPFDPVDSQRP